MKEKVNDNNLKIFSSSGEIVENKIIKTITISPIDHRINIPETINEETLIIKHIKSALNPESIDYEKVTGVITKENQYKVESIVNGASLLFHSSRSNKPILMQFGSSVKYYSSADDIYMYKNSDGTVDKTLRVALEDNVADVQTLGESLQAEVVSINKTIESEIKDVNNNIANSTNSMSLKISEVAQINRKFKPTFGSCCDWSGNSKDGDSWNNTLANIKGKLDVIKAHNVEEISLAIQTKVVNGNISVVSDSILFKQGLDYAISLGLNINCIKLHCNQFRNAINQPGANKESLKTQWKNIVSQLADTYKDYVPNFIVINEGEHIFTDAQYITFVNECLEIAKSKGYKASISPSSVGQWKQISTLIKNSLSYVCINYYPPISTKGFDTSFNDAIKGISNGDVVDVITECKMLNKKLVISETGCNDMPTCLAIPWIWDFKNGEVLGNGTIQNIMLNGILDYFKDNEIVTSVHHWFPFIGDKCKGTLKSYLGGVK